MPSKRLIRDRNHTDLWKLRRFALLVGHVFVRDPHDWRLLEATPGVAGVEKTADGSPLPIDMMDILAVRSAEAEAEVEFDRRQHLVASSCARTPRRIRASRN